VVRVAHLGAGQRASASGPGGGAPVSLAPHGQCRAKARIALATRSGAVPSAPWPWSGSSAGAAGTSRRTEQLHAAAARGATRLRQESRPWSKEPCVAEAAAPATPGVGSTS
jgi:hypothetical protein